MAWRDTIPLQNWWSAIARGVIAIVALAVGLIAVFFVSPAALLTFTVQSNLLIGVSFGWTALALLRDQRTPPEWLAGSAVFYISITGLVYNGIINPGPSEQGVQIVFGLDSNNLAHGFVPTAAVLVWLVFAEHRRIPWQYIWKWLVYGVLYVLVVLALVAFVPAVDAPYDFIDADEHGWGTVAINLGWFFLAFTALSAALVAIDRFLPARTVLSEFDRHDVDDELESVLSSV